MANGNGKLARLQEERRALRGENRELASELQGWASMATDLQGQCPSRLRRFIRSGVMDLTAYVSGRGYVALQQRGWAPDFPLDVVVGVVTQGTAAFFPGGVARVAQDIGDGMASGGMGRVAFLHQAEESEVAGRVVYFKPGPVPPLAPTGT